MTNPHYLFESIAVATAAEAWLCEMAITRGLLRPGYRWAQPRECINGTAIFPRLNPVLIKKVEPAAIKEFLGKFKPQIVEFDPALLPSEDAMSNGNQGTRIPGALHG